MMGLEDIIKWNGYDIVLIRAEIADMEYVNGYVYLEGLSELTKNELYNETYRKGDIVGVDTAHAYNKKMTYEQKKEDAIRQIKEIIEGFERLIIEKDIL